MWKGFMASGLALAALACGGAVGGEAGPTAAQMIADFCADVQRLSCEGLGTEAECRDIVSEARAEAVDSGCTAEFDDVLRCATSQELSCATDVQDLCPSEVGRLDDCERAVDGGPDEGLCGISFGPGPSGVTCGVSCTEFASLCNGPSQLGPLECSCTQGPMQGRTFSASDCSAGLQASSSAACR